MTSRNATKFPGCPEFASSARRRETLLHEVRQAGGAGVKILEFGTAALQLAAAAIAVVSAVVGSRRQRRHGDDQ